MTTGMVIGGVAVIVVALAMIGKEIAGVIAEAWEESETRLRMMLEKAMRAEEYGDIDRRNQRRNNYVSAGMDMRKYRRNNEKRI